MKANYQRHMLYGWAVALCVILIPTLLISVWPVEAVPPGDDDPVTRDTVRVYLDTRDIVIISDDPGVPVRRKPLSKRDVLGPFIDEFTLVDDDLDIDEEAIFGPGGEYEDGPYFEDDPFGFGEGGGGVVFVPDTAEYKFNSAELDRPPVLIAIDQPEYPPLAKGVEVGGTVLLHILVDGDGRVAEVRVEKEDNPGFGFGESAVRVARSAMFSPAIANRQPVRCWVAIPVVFKME
jgi:TonB family protein